MRVLVMDADPGRRERLASALGRSGFAVCATAASVPAALAGCAALPQVVVFGLDGSRPAEVEGVGLFLAARPLPVVVCGSGEGYAAGGGLAARAAALGAVCVLSWDGQAPPADLSGRVRVMSGVCVVQRRPPRAARQDQPAPAGPPPVGPRPRVVVVGSSTGGPEALQELLKALPRPFPLPVVVAQHISDGFLAGMVRWLGEDTGLPCVLAEDGMALEPGRIHFAAEGAHWGVRAGRLLRVDAPPERGLRPSVARLFAAAAEHYGAEAVAVLLTGMGADGAAGLLRLRQLGAATFAQDRASSAVFGMPGEAVRLGAAAEVLRPSAIARRLGELARGQGAAP